MLRILIIGKGKMGTLIKETAIKENIIVDGMVDHGDSIDGFDPDVILDFSHPDNFEYTCELTRQFKCALVYGTTGLSDDQIVALHDLSIEAPIFYSANFSFGVNVLLKILKDYAPILKTSFDMEVCETHHNQKKDAPSGTANMILEAIDPDHEYERVYGRSGFVGQRKHEIGVHALRGGTVAGEHTVYFFGDNETIEIKHSANSRQIFVNGAIKAAKFMQDKAPGFYDMNDMMEG